MVTTMCFSVIVGMRGRWASLGWTSELSRLTQLAVDRSATRRFVWLSQRLAHTKREGETHVTRLDT
eukprot:scaffold78459_cov56-Cyclotella_meneghiniana.AAC.1